MKVIIFLLSFVIQVNGLGFGGYIPHESHAQKQVNKTMCPFRYQGQYEDAETGLYYNRFRYYSPVIIQKIRMVLKLIVVINVIYKI
jgi:hypothetical protein